MEVFVMQMHVDIFKCRIVDARSVVDIMYTYICIRGYVRFDLYCKYDRLETVKCRYMRYRIYEWWLFIWFIFPFTVVNDGIHNSGWRCSNCRIQQVHRNEDGSKIVRQISMYINNCKQNENSCCDVTINRDRIKRKR